MRKIEGYRPEIEREFIPTSLGNRDDSTPVKVWIKTPTELEKRQINSKGSFAVLAVDKNGEYLRDENGNLQTRIDVRDEIERQVETVKMFVTKVENYFSAGGAPITNGEELSKHGETPFIAEIYAEILTGMSLRDPEIKKLERPFDSTAKGTQALDGTAPFAGGISFGNYEIVKETKSLNLE